MPNGERMTHRCRGFTLIELLVVMVLISLLLSIAIPTYFGHVDKAKETVLRQDLAQMRDAIDKYAGDFGRYPDSLEEMAVRRYIRKVPVDPITERTDSWKLVAPERKDMGKVFDVRSGAQGKGKDGSDYASW
jgi:general secretion pathway protein G